MKFSALFLFTLCLPNLLATDPATLAGLEHPPVAELRNGKLFPLLKEEVLANWMTESVLQAEDTTLHAPVDEIWFEEMEGTHYVRARGTNAQGTVINMAMKLEVQATTTTPVLIPIPAGVACVPKDGTCPETGCVMRDYGDGNIDCYCIPAGDCELKRIIIWIPIPIG